MLEDYRTDAATFHRFLDFDGEAWAAGLPCGGIWNLHFLITVGHPIVLLPNVEKEE